MNIGLYFGSFNPIHVGHLIIANLMAESDQLDKVWFVVSPQNPFKPRPSLLHEFDRYDMVRAAIYDNYLLDVTDVEFHMPKPSYTVDTLTYLVERHPGHSFKLIIGQDNLPKFHKWKNYKIILEEYGLLVYPRPASEPHPLMNHEQVKVVQAPLLDISATFIRKRIKAGKSIRYLVPEAVEEMILGKKFYI